MSLAQQEVLSTLSPVSEPFGTSERHLRAVSAPARRPRAVYALVAVAVAVLIGVIQLGISIASTQASFEIHQLQQEQRSLGLRSQELSDGVVGLSSPQNLALTAAQKGMVVGASPSYLRLSDGAVIGTSSAPKSSSVDPRRMQAVPNAILTNRASESQKSSAKNATIEKKTSPKAPVVPATPPVAEGLPTPTTR